MSVYIYTNMCVCTSIGLFKAKDLHALQVLRRPAARSKALEVVAEDEDVEMGVGCRAPEPYAL